MRVAHEPPGASPATPGLRALGASLAAALSFSAAVITAALAETDALSWIVDEGALGLVALAAAIGVPVGIVLGWLYTPAALLTTGQMRVLLVAILATRAVLLGAAIVALLLTFDDLVASGPSVGGLLTAAVSIPALVLVGLVYFGLPGWVLAAAVGAVWVMVVGGAGGHGWPGPRPRADSVRR